MRNPFRRDLVLLHPPAVYDFRTKPAFLGPLADAVPSTAMFEMYPVGLTSIAAFLERNHYNVEIVNLAYRMLQDPRFDVVEQLRRMSAPVFGIDLHWLPHVQGALSVIELVKRLHPESRTLVGGLSASYYHDELVRYPFVDFVLRGDSTEEPARQLLQALRESRPLETVENLTWKRADGTVVVNPLTFVPKDLDYVDVPAYRYLLRSRVQVSQPAESGAAPRVAALSGHAAAERARLHRELLRLWWLAVGVSLDLRARASRVSIAREARRRRRGDRLLLAGADLHGPRSTDGRHAAGGPAVLAARGVAAAERDGVRALLSGRRRFFRDGRQERPDAGASRSPWSRPTRRFANATESSRGPMRSSRPRSSARSRTAAASSTSSS